MVFGRSQVAVAHGCHLSGVMGTTSYAAIRRRLRDRGCSTVPPPCGEPEDVSGPRSRQFHQGPVSSVAVGWYPPTECVNTLAGTDEITQHPTHAGKEVTNCTPDQTTPRPAAARRRTEAGRGRRC